jgi:hypothetical protein
MPAPLGKLQKSWFGLVGLNYIVGKEKVTTEKGVGQGAPGYRPLSEDLIFLE